MGSVVSLSFKGPPGCVHGIVKIWLELRCVACTPLRRSVFGWRASCLYLSVYSMCLCYGQGRSANSVVGQSICFVGGLIVRNLWVHKQWSLANWIQADTWCCLMFTLSVSASVSVVQKWSREARQHRIIKLTYNSLSVLPVIQRPGNISCMVSRWLADWGCSNVWASERASERGFPSQITEQSSKTSIHSIWMFDVSDLL